MIGVQHNGWWTVRFAAVQGHLTGVSSIFAKHAGSGFNREFNLFMQTNHSVHSPIRYGSAFGVSAPQTKLQVPQIELWSIINRWSFFQISECQATLNKRKAP